MKNSKLLKVIMIVVVLVEISAIIAMVKNVIAISDVQSVPVHNSQNTLQNTTNENTIAANKVTVNPTMNPEAQNDVSPNIEDNQIVVHNYLSDNEEFAKKFINIFPEINSWIKVDSSDGTKIYTDNGYTENYNNVLMYHEGTFLLSMNNSQLKVHCVTGVPAADIYITVTDKKSKDIMTALTYALIFVENNPNILKIEDIIELYENDSEYNMNGDKNFSITVNDIEYIITRSNADGSVYVTILCNPH